MDKKLNPISNLFDKINDGKPQHEPEFVKLYLDDVGKLFSLDNNSQRVFAELLRCINPKDPHIHNVIMLNRAIKDRICNKLGFTGVDSKGTPKKYLINNYLIKLTKSKIIKKLESDIYIVNPFICSKVDWNNTELLRALHLNITYEATTKTMVTIVENNEDAISEEIKNMRTESEGYKYSKDFNIETI